MRKQSWQEKLIGQPMPANMLNIDWHEVSGGGQQYGIDQYDWEWRREKEIDCYRFWTHIDSDYREHVDLPVLIDTDNSFIITDVRIEAYVVGHGRPSYISPQAREENQAGRYIKVLFGIK
jgi:hypothetical protein